MNDLKDQVIAALKKVYDPEMPVNIYELGLIYDVRRGCRRAGRHPHDPDRSQLPGGRDRCRPKWSGPCAPCPGVTGVKLELTFDPPWTKDRMSEAAKLALGIEDIIPIARLQTMKLTANEEYGLRCLVRLALCRLRGQGLTIPEISQAEGVSPAYAAKILRVLRKGGFVKAARGKEGGYTLARPAEAIVIGDVIDALGGRLFESDFCDSHAGQAAICTRSVDCSVRSLWRAVQVAVDQVLSKATLRDLLQNEEEMNSWVRTIPGAERAAADSIEEHFGPCGAPHVALARQGR